MGQGRVDAGRPTISAHACLPRAAVGRPTKHLCALTPLHARPSTQPLSSTSLLQDVVYYFKPSRDVHITASLCGSDPATAFDARLALLAGVDTGGGLAPAACAQDVCGSLPALSVRRLGGGGSSCPACRYQCCCCCCWGGCCCLCRRCCAVRPTHPLPLTHPRLQATLRAGVGYAFIVDGVNGTAGQYHISITAQDGGAVTGAAPPASLATASVAVVTVGPPQADDGACASGLHGPPGTAGQRMPGKQLCAASCSLHPPATPPDLLPVLGLPATSAGVALALTTTVAVPGGSGRYWHLGPWGACTADCLQARAVTCHEADGSLLPDEACAAAPKPAPRQACAAANCSVQANSSVAFEAGAGAANGSAADASGASSSSSIVLIAGVAAGSALALVAAGTGFALFRRLRRRRAEAEAHAAIGKWAAEGADASDVIPLPKQLRPIATGRAPSRGRSPRSANVTAAAGAVAAVHQQRGSGRAAAAADYAAAMAQLQQLAPATAPEYHVVHMPSPRFAGTLDPAAAAAAGRLAAGGCGSARRAMFRYQPSTLNGSTETTPSPSPNLPGPQARTQARPQECAARCGSARRRGGRGTRLAPHPRPQARPWARTRWSRSSSSTAWRAAAATLGAATEAALAAERHW